MEDRVLHSDERENPGPAAVVDAPSPSERDAPALSFGGETDEEDQFEFEFPFVSRDSPAGTAAPADELFADGHIRTFYPVFGRGGGGGGAFGHYGTAMSAPAAPVRVRGQLGRLFLEESRARNPSTSSTASSSSSSAATDDDSGGLEGAAPETYCLWTPGSSASASSSPQRRPHRKSGSTGSMARWRRISDLVVGRSHSDGKEKFLFLPAPPHDPPFKDRPRKASAYNNPTKGGAGGGNPRRTFLPYREELVGFFANVNGISRSHHHPF